MSPGPRRQKCKSRPWALLEKRRSLLIVMTNTKIQWPDHKARGPFGVNPLTGRPGPAPNSPRDGDKRQARQRINVEVRTGYRPHPNSLPCARCGHIWKLGERRHEYHHFQGYSPHAHYVVEPLCTFCHSKCDSSKSKATHCMRGHEFTELNTYIKPEGTRGCRACRRKRERHRRTAEYWRQYRLKRRLHGSN